MTPNQHVARLVGLVDAAVESSLERQLRAMAAAGIGAADIAGARAWAEREYALERPAVLEQIERIVAREVALTSAAERVH